MAKKAEGGSSFEDHLRALEEAVRALEAGEETLERSLMVFEGAIGHLRACQEILGKAEKRVKMLVPDEEGGFAEQDMPDA